MPQNKRKTLSSDAGRTVPRPSPHDKTRSRSADGLSRDRLSGSGKAGDRRGSRAQGGNYAEAGSARRGEMTAKYGSGANMTGRSSGSGAAYAGTEGRGGEQRFGATFHFKKVVPDSDTRPSDTRHSPVSKPGYRGSPSARSSESSRRRTSSGYSRGASANSSLRVQKKTNSRRDVSESSGVSGSEVIRSRLTARRMPTIRTVQSRVVRRFPFKTIFVALLCTVLFLLIIYNNVQINEKNSEVDELNARIVELDSEIKDLSLRVEKKNDLRTIEERALELGMVKADELKKVYVSISSADKVELVSEDDGEAQTFRMTGLFERVRDFFTGLFGLDQDSADS